MKNRILLTILILMVYIGCQKSENTTTGNPFVSLAVTSSSANATVAKLRHNLIDLLIPKAFAYPPPATLLDAAGNTVVIQSAWISIEKIEFKQLELADVGEVDGTDVEFQGPYSIDLLSTTPSPVDAGRVSLGQLRRIKIKLARVAVLPAGAPAGFLNKSIYISGTVNGNGFSYSTQDETVAEIAGPQLVSAVENSTLLLELQAANLIKKINLTSIAVPTDIDDANRVAAANPCPNIDVSASDLFTCFRKGFETESNLGRDDDNDFRLDLGEETVK